MKGQGALEYLMTYGWALLIIVVVGAALYASGVLNPATYTQSRCSGFVYFSFQNQKLLPNNGYLIQVQNGNAEVNITGIKAGIMSASAAPSAVTVDGSTPATHIAQAKSIIINTTSDVTDRASGDTVTDFDVEITYDIRNGITGIKDSATCTMKVQ
ncbi:MAG: hypothetical protein HYY37_02805 [Candidatus Aenigmarchaeota archaeon]|nr:hypothetical protein [Candidatus Aenigmarchaeota archaeon]